MMKKIFTLLISFMLMVSLGSLTAQTLSINAQQSPQGNEMTSIGEPHEASRADYVLTYLNGGLATVIGNAMNAGTYHISGCIDYTAAQMANYVGASLVQISVPIPAATYMTGYTSVKVWIKGSLSGAVLYEQTITAPVLGDWNDVVLTTPQTITAGALVIGFTTTHTVTGTGNNIRPLWASAPAGTPPDTYQQGGFNYILSTSATSYGTGASWSQFTTAGNLGIEGYLTGVATLPTNDLAASTIASASLKWVGNSATYAVTVFNAGTASQNSYTVQVIDAANNVIGTQTVNTALASGTSTNINITATPTTAGNLAVRGKVILTGDETAGNDISDPLTQNVYPMQPMGYCTYVSDGAYGPSGTATYPTTGSSAIGYLAANMTPFVGKDLTAFDILLPTAASGMTGGTVWIRSSTTGTDLYSQAFTPVEGWNNIVLNTPYALTNVNTYIGFTVNIPATGAYPLSYSTNTPANANGGHFAIGATWYTLSGQSVTGNMNIIGVVSDAAAPQTVAITTAVSPAGAGTVTGAGTYDIGDPVTLTATANTGYAFVDWTPGSSTTNPLTFNASVDATYTANFQSTTPPACDPATGLTVDINNACDATLTWTAPSKGGAKFVAGNNNVIPKAVLEQYFAAKKAASQNGKTARKTSQAPSREITNSKDVIFTESFETSVGGALPTGWTLANGSAGDDWYIWEEAGYPPDGAHSMTHDDYEEDRDAWAFSPGFALTAGESYSISFYLNMPGYPDYFDFDDFELKIGQAATIAGMTTLLYNKIQDYTDYWELIEVTFIPTTSGTYHLGFHAMTDQWFGDYIDIDEILVSSIDNPTQYNVYRDGVLIAGPIPETTYVDTNITPNTQFEWSVRVVCGDGSESAPVSITGECTPLPEGCDDYEIIPEVVANYWIPINCYYGNNYTQMIYDAAEIGAAGDIASFKINALRTLTRDNVTVFMANTTKSTFSGNSDWVPYSELTQVWSGVVELVEGQWIDFNLGTPFEYTGDNLVVAFLNNQGNSGNGNTNSWNVHNTTTDKCINAYSDNAANVIDPASPPNATGTQAFPKRRANISFEICGGDVPCVQTDVEVGGLTSVNGNYLPVLRYYKNSYSQFIYDAADLQGAGPVSSLSFYDSNAGVFDADNITLWLGNTTKDEFTSATTGEFVPVGQMEQVFHGAVIGTAGAGWITIEFDNEFEYTGGNLVVAIHNSQDPYLSPGNRYYNTSTGSAHKTIQTYSDTQTIDPNNPVMYGASYTHYLFRPDIKLDMCVVGGTTPSDCDPVNNVEVAFDANCVPTITWDPAKGGKSRDVIYSEGFEGGLTLPTGWTATNAITGGSEWMVTDYLGGASGQTVWANSGINWACNIWTSAKARDAWMFSSGFALEAGTAYDISFFLKLAGFPSLNEHDHFEAKIGQTATPAGMTTELYYNTTTYVPNWTNITSTFTPTTSGTYYLGFHAFTPADLGNDIDIDDIEISTAGGTTTNPKYNVYRDGVLIAGAIEATSYVDVAATPGTQYEWSVAAICDNGTESDLVSATGTCAEPGDCNPVTNLAVDINNDCDATLTWTAPAKGGKAILVVEKNTLLAPKSDLEGQCLGMRQMTKVVKNSDFHVGETVATDRLPEAYASLYPNAIAPQYNLRVFADAYVGNTYTGGNYSSIVLETGAKTMVGSMPTLLTDETPTGEDFDGTTLYRITNQGRVFSVSETGTTTLIGSIAGTANCIGLAYDWVNQDGFYFTDAVGSGTYTISLYKVALPSLTKTLIGAAPAAAVFRRGLALSTDGYLYSLSTATTGTSNLYKIDPANGSVTTVGSIGFQAMYGFDMVFDRTTNVLYACPIDYTLLVSKLITLNTTTGASTLVFDYGLLQHAIISTTKGDPGVQVAYNVYRDGALIAGPITATTYVDTNITPDTQFEWSVAAICDDGGESTLVSVTGECISDGDCDPVNNVAVTFNNSCVPTITWDPAKGKGAAYGDSHSDIISMDAATINTPSRALVYSEGFEGTTGNALPTGWLKTTGTNWITIADGDPNAIPGVQNLEGAVHSGQRSMARSWQNSGNTWAYSAGFNLVAGEAYTISFWYQAPGYPQSGEFDNFEAKLGTSQTSAGMTHTLLTVNNTIVNDWTLSTGSYTATTSGTYYIGFHDLNPAQTGIFITIDDIEVNSYEAPPTYNVYRDGTLIAGPIEATSYVDNTATPGTEYTWSVTAVCPGGGESAQVSATGQCDNSECLPVANLTVNINLTTCNTTIAWDAPSKKSRATLWDNTQGMGTNGFHSCRWVGGNARLVMADDFNVPAGEIWTIQEVFAYGFPNAQTTPLPEHIGVEIYTDDGNKPSATAIYSNITLSPSGGGELQGEMLIPLPEPFTISTPGKYWISIYGAYTGPTNTSKQYYIVNTTVANGEPMHRWDPTNLYGTGNYVTWTSGLTTDPSTPSMAFAIFGVKEGLKYNVYRDGTKIAGPIDATSYVDNNVTENVTHVWAVETVCTNGDVSPQESESGFCDKDGIETFGESVQVYPNPASTIVNIVAKDVVRVEVYNVLGQLVERLNGNVTQVNVTSFNSGVYTFRVIDINDNMSNTRVVIEK